MKLLNLGQTDKGEVVNLDFEAEGIHCILLAGVTNSGKSIFHNNLYKELTEKYSPEEIQFVFLDMTRVDFMQWQGPYLLQPSTGSLVKEKPFETLEALAEKAEAGEFSKTSQKITFLQIEECDMALLDNNRFKLVMERLLKNKESSNLYIVFSTSKILSEVLSSWMHLIDLKVVFRVANSVDSHVLLGDDSATYLPETRERILVWNNKRVLLRPFSKEEAEMLSNWELPKG